MHSSTASIVTMGDREFKTFRDLIHRQSGIYLQDGKQVMLASRLARRLRHHGLNDFSAYAALLEQGNDDGKELAEMINCITTNKTAFFREPHHFEFLAQTLVPEMVAGAALGRKRVLRIWSAACSSGEEPYSITIAVLEALAAAYPNPIPGSIFSGPAGGWQVEIIASDIDTQMLARAAEGIYDHESVAAIPAELKAKYFLRGKGERDGQVRVKKEVSDLVKFVRINLMDKVWPLDGKFEAIFFRNTLIYFTRQTQEVFLRRMLSLLQSQAYLILGHSEHVPWLNDSVNNLGNTIHKLLPQRRPPYTGPDRRRRQRT